MSKEEEEKLRLYQRYRKSSPDLLKESIALSRAAGNGWEEVTRFLVESGADANSADALKSAAGFGHLEVCKLLVKMGCKPKEKKHQEALIDACHNNYIAVVEYLLNQGMTLEGMEPGWMDKMLNENFSLSVFKTICDAGYPLKDMTLSPSLQSREPKDYGGAIHMAASHGNLDIVKACLEYGVPVDQCHPINKLTPLHLATFHGHDNVVEYLLKKEASVDAKANFEHGRTVLELTLPGGRPMIHSAKIEKIQTLLLEAGAVPNTDILNALIREGKLDLFRFALKSGLDLEKRDRNGITPMKVAIGNQNWDMVQELHAYGAKIDAEHWNRADANLRRGLTKLLKHPKWQEEKPGGLSFYSRVEF